MTLIGQPQVICIATYRREPELRTLLESLRPQIEASRKHDVRVVVVDNATPPTTESIVQNVLPGATWIHQPQPGIVAARRTAVKAAASMAPAGLIFIDDDEHAHENWLETILRAATEWNCDIVSGPVEYILDPRDEWLRAGCPYFEIRQLPRKAPIRDIATNNTWVRGTLLVGHDAQDFDDSFSMTGGSDKELFYRLTDGGAVALWEPAALVYETVPRSRSNLAWVRQRDRRNGQINARLRLKREEATRFQVFSIGVIKIVLGLSAVMFEKVLRREHSQGSYRRLEDGRGFVAAALDRMYREYEQKAPPKPPQS